MTERLSRRSFLSLNFEATVGFIGNFIAPQIEQEREYFRPPGAGSELGFLTSCTRCGKCAESCNDGAISLFSLEHGVKIANTPYLDPNLTPCTFCEKCIEVCPTGALSLKNILGVPSIGSAKLVTSNCLAFKDILCDYCVRSCPVDGAMVQVGGKPVVNELLCNGCGICVSSCISDSKGIFVELPKENG